jgi:hypothetical protein
MSVLNDLVAVGFEMAMTLAGATVAYRRGDKTIDCLDAIPTQETYTVADEQGILQEIHSRDYLVDAANLVINKAVVEPRVGDRITETIDGQDMVFEVFPIEKQRCFRYRDASRATIRIHTKRVA